MSSSVIGLGWLLLFAALQGMRDAFFGNIFQSVSFLLVAALAFATSTACFTALTWLRKPQDFRVVYGSFMGFAALNITTAAAWLSFFFGLKHLEPAAVATLYNGIGPLVVLALEGLGLTQRGSRPGRGECLCYVGITSALSALVVVVLSNQSGLPSSNFVIQIAALALVIAGGIMITISHMIARWFNDAGAGSHAVMGTRFLLTLIVASGAEWFLGESALRPPLDKLPFLALAAFFLIILPSFMLQLGIARSSPLAVNVMRALGPVFVFGVQQLDGRLRFSGATLICITAFCLFAVVASILRAWAEMKRAPLSS